MSGRRPHDGTAGAWWSALRALCAVMVIASAGSVVRGEPEGGAESESRVPAWIERMLESLEPSRPRAYFEAAESMMRGVPEGSAPGASVAAARRLTQETLVIAWELWRKGPARVDDPRLGPGVLLAIAAMEPDPTSERARWLRVLASAVDSQGLVSAVDAGSQTSNGGVDDSAVIDVLSALELLRGGGSPRSGC